MQLFPFLKREKGVAAKNHFLNNENSALSINQSFYHNTAVK